MSRTPAPHRPADWLWRIGIVSLSGSAAVALTSADEYWNVWVIGPWVPRLLDVVGALTGVGLLLLVLGVSWRIVLGERGVPPRQRHWARVLGAALTTSAVLLAALPLTALIALLESGDRFHVLPRTSAGPWACPD